jgi:trans-aconitate 2-methyltransferase
MNQKRDASHYQARHSCVFAYGEGLIDIMAPRAGERIVDLGCGAGQLEDKIAESGAEVLGIDRSEEMIEEARRNFPALQFKVADAANFTVNSPVDAVFSNAALHWLKDADGVANSVARALRPAGRFVIEMGGKATYRRSLTP